MILLTGASGYVGKKLLYKLEELSLPLRCLARRPEKVGPSSKTTEIVRGDVFDMDSLRSALQGAETAYYLIHSMGTSDGFEEADRRAAENFSLAARDVGVRQIIYLGGLGSGTTLSPHLRSRHEVGEVLRRSGIPVIEFRASIVIGPGSLSFEMVRALIEKLPIMITPRWVRTPSQPIAIEDVVAYLVAGLQELQGGVFEIGGPDVLSYGDLMMEYARVQAIRRWMLPVPFLTPWLSSLWLGLVTPLYAKVGKKLIESVCNNTVVNDNGALRHFPIKPRGLRQAIQEALTSEDREFSKTRWSHVFPEEESMPPWGGVKMGNRIVDSYGMKVPFPPERAFRPIRRIGGKTGWYCANFLWRLRGAIDELLGGPGMRRCRQDPECPVIGNTLDFWRIEDYEPNRLLQLSAEMKVPGQAWLQFEVTPVGNASFIRQTAIFAPRGLPGLLYWYALYPVHWLIFRGMLRNMALAI